MKFQKRLYTFLAATALLVGCNSKVETSTGTGSSTITLSGVIGSLFYIESTTPAPLMIDENGVIAPFAPSDYKLFCVTFASSPTAATSSFGTDGSFSLSLPANTPFGCFVNSATTNLPVATVVVASTGTGFSGTDSSSMSLSGSVDVGSLTLDLANNKVEIPAAKVSGSTSSASTSLNLSDVDNYNWTMSCVTTGVTEIDTACSSFIGGSNTVYLRILQATESSQTVYGISVWENYTQFQNCGSIDFNTNTKTSIEGSGVVFATTGSYAPATAGTFSNYGTTCALRSANGDSSYASKGAGDADAHKNIKSNYCLAKIKQTGNGYSFDCEDGGTSGSCTYYHKTSVTFTPGASAAEMYGNFISSEQRSAGCGSATDSTSTFNVKFNRSTQAGT